VLLAVDTYLCGVRGASHAVADPSLDGGASAGFSIVTWNRADTVTPDVNVIT